ncbi:putative beta-ketoacyl synthase [Monocercomonoides exilis]|uniref:putative beta-ketoacyl synthase n=1 Tax=Monocercomonoides exilis TaxID=2049356 RepID=UPI00355AC793|nr:putative beta-ketoacyl synthase [Monocercomonoides exilis]|eukprot:MONOS_6449.1-p1 / transcript=MONOS_6449.1 / gene=MONOS_6449 / organism=Monocercomonoides_exilis_PA203 / gene_product=polyketide synthase PksE / transcript_product=polyketide synthase PksE / location=Mono_scaffold00203:4589-15496(+) / protein_length=3635 / sequence_SO=supercontig / SO=protein_coding / is_pseudo=false
MEEYNGKSSESLSGPQDPIAIVGLGARLPGGANSPEQFWKLLLEGYDAITDVPKERWDGNYFHDPENLGLVGKSIQNKGGFLKGYNIDEVDLKFFYLSPREAKSLDPNQRLLLEVTYETFENAGLTLEQVSGSRTGVFVGISATDYSHLQFPDINTIDVHTQTGVSTSIVANRVSYFYNLIGPSFIVDTACSSTLVALNCACQSMRTHECDAALCGAVNLMMFPEITVGFSKLGVLSPDGHCKAFDAKANGYVRSEGCGAVLLKRLSDAERDGNRIYAVIRGTHVGSDGHYQQQMTSPSEQQQAVVIREVLKKSDISSVDVGYVESHGTGTFVGDPIECRSVSSVLNIGREGKEPILIGSAKSNVGHLEPAAGIVSLVKIAMVMKHGIIPPTISMKKPNPNIDMQKLNVKIVTNAMKFPAPPRCEVPRTALISAFGFGGTNGGCIVQEYRGGKGLKDVKKGLKEIEREELFLLSARSVEALKGQAKRLAEYLSSKTASPIQHVAYTLGCHRTQHKQCRLAFIANSKESAIAELNAFIEDKNDTGAVQTRFTSFAPSEKKRKLCLVYCGQGSQWYGMGRVLYRENVVFREWMDRIDNCLKEAGAEYSIVEEITTGTEETSHIHEVEYLQPIFFAIQVSLTKVMEAAGLKPDAIVGHSLGEIAAAHVSGALSIEDATRVVWERAKGQKVAHGMGYMAAVTAEDGNDLKRLIEGKGVDIAGHNAPKRWNISGETAGLDEVEKLANEKRGSTVRVRRLLVDEPMHSQFVDLSHDQIIEGLEGISPARPTTTLISTYTPSVKEVKMDGYYWWASLRNPVLFMDAIQEMIRRTSTDSPHDAEENAEGEQENKGIEWVFLECGPHNVLRTFLSEIMAVEKKPFVYVPTLLRKAENERLLMLRTLANMFSLGYNLDLKKSVFVPYNTYDERQARVLFEESSLSAKEDVQEYYFVPDLPYYSWARTKCWNESPVQHEHRLGPVDGHPIARIRQDTLNPCWQSDISTSHIPWVLDHCLQGNIVVPGVTFVECILTCGRRVFGDRPFWLRDVQFLNAFYMNKGETFRVTISLDPINKPGSRSSTVDAYNVTLSSRLLPSGEYTLHCALVMEAEEQLAEREKKQLEDVVDVPVGFTPSHPANAFDDVDLDEYRKLCPIEIPIDQFFSQLWVDGLELSRQLRLTRRIWFNDRDNPVMSIAYIEVNPETTEEELGKWGFMYPPLLDSCLQSGLSARAKRGAFFPVSARRARFARSFPKNCRHCWSLSRKDPVTGNLSMTCCDDEGHIYGSLQDVVIRYLESGKRGSKLGMIGGPETPMFEHKWEQIAILPSYERESCSKSAAFPLIPFDESDDRCCTDSKIVKFSDKEFTEHFNCLMNSIGAEFQAQEIAENVIPLNNLLTDAIILEVFRSKLNLWKEEADLIKQKKLNVADIKPVPVKQLAESASILPFYHRLFLLLCRYMSDSGYFTLNLTAEAQKKDKSEPIFFIENYVVAPLAPFFHDETQPLPHNEDCDALASEILTKYPQMRPSTMLMMDVGRRMKDVIVDGEKAISMIFKDKGLADSVYRDDGEVRTLNYVVQGGMKGLTEHIQRFVLPKTPEKLDENLMNLLKGKHDKPLTILEVGAGTGGTTDYLLEFLDPLTTTYTYTDISASFFGTAKERFSRYSSFMNFKILNIENSPMDQGFEPYSQDIIIAANVVHATSDLFTTLTHIMQLLKPGGHLVLLEALNGLRWLDLVFGLTDGWWALKDTNFRQHPLLTPDMWRDILKRVGFETCQVVNEWTADSKLEVEKKLHSRLGMMVARTKCSLTEEKEKVEILLNEQKQGWMKKAFEREDQAPTTTCVVFAEERNVLSGRIVSSLLRDGHFVIAASHKPLPTTHNNEDESFLRTLCDLNTTYRETDPIRPKDSLLNEEEMKVYIKHFHAIYVPDASKSRKGYDAIFEYVSEHKLASIVSLVHLWSLDLPCVAKTEEEVKLGFEMNIYSPLYLAHALMDASKTASVSSHITTWGVTEGVWSVSGQTRGIVKGEVGLGQSTIWGLNRSIINEIGTVHPRSLDIGRCPGLTEVQGVVGVICSTALDAKEKSEVEGSSSSITADTSAVIPLNETEIAIRGNKCFGQRLVEVMDTSELGVTFKSLQTNSDPFHSAANSFTLTSPGKGLLWLEERKRKEALAEHEVEIDVAGCGVTAHDVSVWQRSGNSSKGQSYDLGNEFAGVVRRVGTGVTRVKVGDFVFGVGKECCGSFVTISESHVAAFPKDCDLSWDQASGLGLELSAAVYSLVNVGRVKKGDYVLITGATGATGLIAIEICRQVGAIPIVTSRSEYKRRWLQYMGLKHVLDTDAITIVEKCREITNGKGVKIAVNAVPVDAILKAALTSLRKGGALVDLCASSTSNLHLDSTLLAGRNITYRAVDILQMFTDPDSEEEVIELMDECTKVLSNEQFAPPPVTTFALSQAKEAYEAMKSENHSGKIVLFPISSIPPLFLIDVEQLASQSSASSSSSVPSTLPIKAHKLKYASPFIYSPVAVPFAQKVLGKEAQGSYIDPTKTYLVTGGTAGFSLELAVGLLERGAKHLAVSSRSGAGNEERQRKFQMLREKYDAEIKVFSCDASSSSETRAMLAEIRKTMPPLTGVIHGAMLLHDGYLMNLDDKAFWEVLGPKSFGAWLIHDDTVKNNDPITMFVLLSSLNVVVGTHGQANYGSANMFLDSLCLHRRSCGLPCISLQWGVLGDVGYVHRNTSTIGQNMGQFGFRAFSANWAKRVMHTCLEAQADLEQMRSSEWNHESVERASHSLTSTMAERLSNTYKALPVGLLPGSLRPENDVVIKSHFFDGSENFRNVLLAREVYKHPLFVPVTVGVFNVSWKPLFAFMQTLGDTARMRYMKEASELEAAASESADSTKDSASASSSSASSSSSKGTGSYSSVSDALRSMVTEEESIAFLARSIANEAARVLGLSSGDAIVVDVPLSQYGLDSLTAVEMKNWTEKQVKVDIPVVDFVRGPSSDQLAKSMLVKFYETYGKPKQKQAEEGKATEADGKKAEAAKNASSATQAEKEKSSASEKADEEAQQAEVQVEKRKQPLTAYVFTGQSGLKAGVGMDIYDMYPEAKLVWDKCDEHFVEELGISILKIVRENPKEYVIDFTDGEKGKKLREKYMNLKVTNDEEVMKEVKKIDPTINAHVFPTVNERTESYTFHSPNGLLNMTHFAQPIIIIYEYAALACLEAIRKKSSQNQHGNVTEGIHHMFCGHSLGEYCALTAMGDIASAEEMAMVCFMRGMVMQSCVPRDPVTHMTDYAMAAVSPMRVAPWFKIEHLRRVMESTVNACGGRLLQIVNYNVYNDQYVVSGERYAILQLSLALTHVEEMSREKLAQKTSSDDEKDNKAMIEEIMSTVDRFCYVSIGTHPHSSTPLELQRTSSVMQLKGIDMPFHSRLLRKVVPLFRSFLDSRLPSVKDYSYADRLVGRFITNTYSQETFSLSLSYVQKMVKVTDSPYLKEALGELLDPSANEMMLLHEMKQAQSSSASASSSSEARVFPRWLSMSANEKARLLLRESLSYQFASPVQWIDAQNTLMLNGVVRVVEIGPAKTLSTMFSKSTMRLGEQGELGKEITKRLNKLVAQQKEAPKDQKERAIPKTNGVEIISFATDRELLEALAMEEI